MRLVFILEIAAERLQALADRILWGKPEPDPNELREFSGHITFGDYPG